MMLVAGSSSTRPPGTRIVLTRTKSRPVRHDESDRVRLTPAVRTGSHPAQQMRRARILLELDEDDPDRHGPVPTQDTVAARAGVCPDTVVKVAKAYADRGGEVSATITRKKQATPPVEPKVTGEVEARIVTLANSQPPAGYQRWSLRLLERHVVLMDDIPDLDQLTIGRILEKRHFALT